MTNFRICPVKSRIKRGPIVISKDAAIASVAGLFSWFDASHGVTADASGVSAIADRVTGGAGYQQATAGNRPALVPIGLGNRPSLQFTAASKSRLDFKGAFPNTSFTKYIVAQPSGLTSNQMIYGSTQNPKHFMYVTDSKLFNGIGTGGVLNSIAYPAGTVCLYIASWNATTGVASVAINDGANVIYVYGVQGTAFSTALYVGADLSFGNAFDGMLSEGILISGYDHLGGQSPADYALIMSYIAAKYATSIPKS